MLFTVFSSKSIWFGCRMLVSNRKK